MGSNSDGITSPGPPLQGKAVLGTQPGPAATGQDWPKECLLARLHAGQSLCQPGIGYNSLMEVLQLK